MTLRPAHIFLSVLMVFCFLGCLSAQTTEFNFQGSLKDGTGSANGNYDFEFRLFSVDTGGTAIGTIQRLNTSVANGVFTVKLDFGNQFFGALRYLEIAVRPAGSGSFTTLLPRQQVSNAPYSIQSINSTNSGALGGIAPAGYLQNTTAQQPGSNFNISGSGNVGGRLRVEGISNGNLASFGGNGDFQIDANGIVGGRFTVLQGGNVGIGTATPTSKLTVEGTVQSDSGGFKFPDGSVQSVAAPNTLYTVSRLSTSIPLSTTVLSETTIIHFAIPNGTYLVLAQVDISNSANTFGADNHREALCRFSTDAVTGDQYPASMTLGGVGDSTLSFHSIATITNGGIDLICRPFSWQDHLSTFSLRITAIKVAGNVTIQ